MRAQPPHRVCSRRAAFLSCAAVASPNAARRAGPAVRDEPPELHELLALGDAADRLALLDVARHVRHERGERDAEEEQRVLERERDDQAAVIGLGERAHRRARARSTRARAGATGARPSRRRRRRVPAVAAASWTRWMYTSATLVSTAM